MAKDVKLEDLLKAGCHFGHQTKRSHSRALDFVYDVRGKVQIIDLGKTREQMIKAYDFMRDLAASGAKILFAGTKRQARGVVSEEAKKCGMPYVTNRWVGGLMTNWEEVKKNLKRMEEIENKLNSKSQAPIRPELMAEGKFQIAPPVGGGSRQNAGQIQNSNSQIQITKKEKILLERRLRKLEELYGGMRDLEELPGAVFLVDVRKEETAARECQRKGIPVIAVIDTNSDPTMIDYPIPANDDAVGSIKFIVEYLGEAVREGKSKIKN